MYWGFYSQWGIVEFWFICLEDYGWCECIKGSYVDNYMDYKKEYEGLKEIFNLVKFNLVKWVEVVKDVGMCYMIFMIKYYDGFFMFDLKYIDYKVMDEGCVFSSYFKVNIIKEIFEVFWVEDFWVGVYFFKFDWYYEVYWDFYWLLFDCNVNYDFVFYLEKWEIFVQFMYNQLLELFIDYGVVDIIWFDGGWVKKCDQYNLEENYVGKFFENKGSNGFIKYCIVFQDICMDELVVKVCEKQLGLIVVDCVVYGKNQNYFMFENCVLEKELFYFWEFCIIFGGGWFYILDVIYMSGWEGI